MTIRDNIISLIKTKKIKPFLRWAGGKTWLLKDINQFLPEKIINYYEPFLGGGSIFIHLKNNNLISNRAYISDTNANLINAYTILRDYPEVLINVLKTFENTSDNYYAIREQNYKDPIERAAQFIFLNRTSFNGIYRENLKGVYNVPYGNKSYKELFDFENMQGVSNLLNGTELISCDFFELKPKISKGDFIFLDPPYTVAHQHNGFVKYNQKIFSWEDQIRLKEFVEYIIDKEANFILTNASHESINELYKGIGDHHFLQRASVIGGKVASRNIYEEIIITNEEMDYQLV